MYSSLLKQFNIATSAGKKLHKVALTCLGQDVGDSGYGDEVDCAITVNNVVFKAFQDYVGGDISTLRMFHALKGNKKFVQVKTPLAGDIIISPTGYGNGRLSNGHTGFISYGDKILSNDSKTGLFMPNYTRKAWKERYSDKGGFPIYYFRRISY